MGMSVNKRSPKKLLRHNQAKLKIFNDLVCFRVKGSMRKDGFLWRKKRQVLRNKDWRRYRKIYGQGKEQIRMCKRWSQELFFLTMAISTRALTSTAYRVAFPRRIS